MNERDEMCKGYIKLFRRVMNSPVYGNPNIWRFFEYCILKATHEPYKDILGYQEVPLQPGQFVYGITKAMGETGLTESAIKSSIKALKKRGSITVKATNKYSIITIVNWKKYQEDWKGSTHTHAAQALANDSSDNQQQTSKHPTNVHIQEQVEQKAHQETISEEEFNEWFAPYPVKEAKKAAFKAYCKARKEVSKEILLDGVRKLAEAVERGALTKKFTPKASRWLEEGRWDDEYGHRHPGSVSLADYGNPLDYDGKLR